MDAPLPDPPMYRGIPIIPCPNLVASDYERPSKRTEISRRLTRSYFEALGVVFSKDYKPKGHSIYLRFKSQKFSRQNSSGTATGAVPGTKVEVKGGSVGEPSETVAENPNPAADHQQATAAYASFGSDNN